jgi:hypothetical protein
MPIQDNVGDTNKILVTKLVAFDASNRLLEYPSQSGLKRKKSLALVTDSCKGSNTRSDKKRKST